MKPLIATDSRLYAGRLIKEIKDVWARGHGVYYCPPIRVIPGMGNPRLSAARYNYKRHCIVIDTNLGRFYVCPAHWDCFIDNASGKEIFASRSQY